MAIYPVNPTDFKIYDLENFLAGTSVNPMWKHYKGFEQDLRGELNPTHLLERYFWEEKRWMDFPDFATAYIERNEPLIRSQFPEIFQSLGHETFLHLRARLYRTQFGFLTEYHAVILISTVFTLKGYTVWRGTDLDTVGVDCQIVKEADDKKYNIHIFVDSQRAWHYREKKRRQKHSDRLTGRHVDFPYTMQQGCIHSLKMLPNGFGVYTEEYVNHLLSLIEQGIVDTKVQRKEVDCRQGLVFE